MTTLIPVPNISIVPNLLIIPLHVFFFGIHNFTEPICVFCNIHFPYTNTVHIHLCIYKYACIRTTVINIIRVFYFQTASKVTTTVCLIFQKTHVTRAPPWIFCWPNSPPEADSEEVSESEIKHHISLERRRWALNRFGGLMIALFQFLLLKSRSKTIDVKKNATCKYTSKCMQDTFIELVHTWFQADYTTIDSTCLKLKKKKKPLGIWIPWEESWA